MFLFFPVKIGLYLKCCYHNTKEVLVQWFELWTHLLSFAPYQQQTIQERTVISDWSKAPQLLLITCLVVWKFSLMASGAQFVMISGDRQSLMLPVDSLGIHVLHSLEMPHFWGEKKPLVFIIVCSWHVLVKTATNLWYFPVHRKKYICSDVVQPCSSCLFLSAGLERALDRFGSMMFAVALPIPTSSVAPTEELVRTTVTTQRTSRSTVSTQRLVSLV